MVKNKGTGVANCCVAKQKGVLVLHHIIPFDILNTSRDLFQISRTFVTPGCPSAAITNSSQKHKQTGSYNR